MTYEICLKAREAEEQARKDVRYLKAQLKEMAEKREVEMAELNEHIAQLKDQLQETKARVGLEGKVIKKEASVQAEAMADFMGGIYGISPGTMVTLQGLEGLDGRKLNGQTAIVLRTAEREVREKGKVSLEEMPGVFEVRVESTHENRTLAAKHLAVVSGPS